MTMLCYSRERDTAASRKEACFAVEESELLTIL
jgi:hypothetical protein